MLLLAAAISFAFRMMPGSIRPPATSTDFAWACFNPGASEATGNLRVYESETQDGTIAVLDFRDDYGRIFLSAYYSLMLLMLDAPARNAWPHRKADIREQDLFLRTIEFRDADQQGRLVASEAFAKDGVRIRRHTWEYDDATGRKKAYSAMWANSKGDRYGETSFSEGTQTTRTFDEHHNLLTITGDIPLDEWPPGGWGPEDGGIAVHLAVTPVSGPAAATRMALTWFDMARRQASTYHGVFPFLELRGPTGGTIRPLPQYEARLREHVSRRGGKEPCDRPTPNAENGASEIDLTETYGDLPPGNYSLVGGACLDGSGARSNPVLMTLEEPAN